MITPDHYDEEAFQGAIKKLCWKHSAHADMHKDPRHETRKQCQAKYERLEFQRGLIRDAQP